MRTTSSIVAVAALVGALMMPASAAEQKQKGSVTRVSTAGKCSFDACQSRGVKRGFSPSAAASWCSSNRNGC
ncbi:MAG: hypothetical protein JWM46_910 [Candidatus Kaiserbacteria bacterium]|nr:hypothetical protein [Candidatus Kaiserbacteria bacterium]